MKSVIVAIVLLVASQAQATVVYRPPFVPVAHNVAAINALHAQQLLARQLAARALTLKLNTVPVVK